MFRLTSAFLNTGINELFKELGRKYLSPENGETEKKINDESNNKNIEKNEKEDNRNSLRLKPDSKIPTNSNEKKKCCRN